MRFIVYGAGAVGGVVGGRMFQHGHDVVLVARGEHRRAIAANGLTVEWPEGSATLEVPVVGHASELSFAEGDVVIVAVKSQDTDGVLDALAAVAPPTTPIVCLQNGVANEVSALRRFANVHGVTVMAPTWHLEPGVVQSYTPDATAMLDIGRWPHGSDATTEAVAAAFVASGFESIARRDIARWKYTKLLLNLGNPVDALCARDANAAELVRRARQEGMDVLAAAGIDHVSEEEDKARRGDVLRIVPIDERRRPGGSTFQSLARGASVEVDYLNGEIVLLGRLHGVPTPVNELLQHATHRASAEGTPPGSLAASELLEGLDSRSRVFRAGNPTRDTRM
jgi:2-dehydropantoate 2-reductase